MLYNMLNLSRSSPDIAIMVRSRRDLQIINMLIPDVGLREGIVLAKILHISTS